MVSAAGCDGRRAYILKLLKAAVLAQVSDKVARILLRVPLVQSFNGSWFWFLEKPGCDLV